MQWLSSLVMQMGAGLLVVGLTAAVVAAATKFRIDRRVRIFGPEGERINTRFYDHFYEIIDAAQDEILVTGEGFGYTTARGAEAANRYHEAMDRVLRRGVHVTRIQTGRPLSRKWAERLGELVDAYPDQFHLFILNNTAVQDIASVCVIDPDRSKSVVEMMLSTDKDIGDLAVRLASTGLFIHGRRELAGAMKNNIRAIQTAPIAKQIEFSKDIEQFLETDDDHVYYFAFGSNMSKAQMARRCPSAEFVGIGKLEGFQVVFNRIGDHRDGGVASVATALDRETCVYGAIWKLSLRDIESLDADEVPTSYKRIIVDVIHEEHGEQLPCEIYVAFPQAGPIRPDREYLEIMVSAAVSAQLPAEYIEYLKAFRNQV